MGNPQRAQLKSWTQQTSPDSPTLLAFLLLFLSQTPLEDCHSCPIAIHVHQITRPNRRGTVFISSNKNQNLPNTSLVNPPLWKGLCSPLPTPPPLQQGPEAVWPRAGGRLQRVLSHPAIPAPPPRCRGHLGNLLLLKMLKNVPVSKEDSFLSLAFLGPIFPSTPMQNNEIKIKNA